MTFSERIIEIKNNRKLLQKDIAQAINVTVRQYQRYEKNQTQPTLSVLQRTQPSASEPDVPSPVLPEMFLFGLDPFIRPYKQSCTKKQKPLNRAVFLSFG